MRGPRRPLVMLRRMPRAVPTAACVRPTTDGMVVVVHAMVPLPPVVPAVPISRQYAEGSRQKGRDHGEYRSKAVATSRQCAHSCRPPFAWLLDSVSAGHDPSFCLLPTAFCLLSLAMRARSSSTSTGTLAK